MDRSLTVVDLDEFLDQMETAAAAYWASRRSQRQNVSRKDALDTPAAQAGRNELP
jgi:hypothetical protein